MDSTYPFHVQLHLTDKCNLKCKHCYEGERKVINEWDYDELMTVINKLDTAFVKWNVDGEISLVGGEPLMYPHFPRLLYEIRKSKSISRIAILTNGTCMNDETKKAILDTKPAVQISIDGINEEKHDLIRGKGNYQKSISTIKWLVDHDIEVFVHYVISKYSVPITKDFILKMNKLGVKQLTFSRVVPMGSSDISIMLSPEELHEVYNCLFDYASLLSEDEMSINTTRPLWACYGKTGRCPVGIQTITILPDGTALPCRRLPIPLGNIKTESFYSIWYNSDVLWNLRKRENIEKCGECKHLNECGGGRCIAYAVTGNYMGGDPQCWL
ncbi:MAG: radical SAM protein [Oscillospiraceae bacterium]